MSEKAKKISFIVFLIFIILIVGFFVVAAFNYAPVNGSDDSSIEFEIKPGTGKGVIANNLEKSKLIRSSFFLKVYMVLSDSTLFAGTYKLSPSMSALEILDVIESEESLENETISLTFIEGKRLSSYVKQISESFGYSEEEIYSVLSDSEFLASLISKYWFLSNDILNSEIYYSLEGYIYPDTYAFKKVSSIEDIIIKTLDNMDAKLSEYKEETGLESLKFHEILTLASVIELEGANSNDRAGVAGVFYNRLEANWTLGSDVTTYYAVGKDFSVDLTYVDLNSCNGYNTRGTCVEGLPVGPIASPSLESIVAAINPKEHDNYYFVADINKNTYFSKTGVEHEKTVAKLKSEGLWYEY